MPNLSIKLHHRYVYIGKIIHIVLSVIWGFRHPLGVLQCVPPGSGGTTIFYLLCLGTSARGLGRRWDCDRKFFLFSKRPCLM